jgi:hypothetical protein
MDSSTFESDAGLIFTTPILQSPLHLRGASTLNLNVIAQDKAQYFAYLYFLNPETGIANWVGHAPFTCHQSEGCATQPGVTEEINLEFYWTAVDIPAGTQLMLIVDGYDPDYWRYSDSPEDVTVVFDPQKQLVLDLPIVWENPDYDDTQQTDEDISASIDRSSNGTTSGFDSTGAGGGLGLLTLLAFISLVRFRKNTVSA